MGELLGQDHFGLVHSTHASNPQRFLSWTAGRPWSIRKCHCTEVYGYTGQDPSTPCYSNSSLVWRYNIPTSNWSGNSPYLNPIEGLWYKIKHHLSCMKPRSSKRADIIRAVEDIWESLTLEDFEHHIASMPCRVQVVIAANDGHTRW